MNCNVCGKKMKRTSIPNPLGLARTDLYVCTACKDELYFGSKALWEKFGITTTALSSAIDTLKTIRNVVRAAGIEEIAVDGLKDIKKVVLPKKGKKRAKKSN